MIEALKVKDIRGLKPLATGYKMFNPDWSSSYGDFNYSFGEDMPKYRVFREKNSIQMCQSGIHFCTNASDCLGYYKMVPKAKFAKVKAYEELIEGENKNCCKTIKIVKIYTYDEFIDIVDSELRKNEEIIAKYGINNTRYGIENSKGGRYLSLCKDCVGDHIHYSKNVKDSYNVISSAQLSECEYVGRSEHITNSIYVYNSDFVIDSYNISNSTMVKNSKGVRKSENIQNSSHIANCDNVIGSRHIENSSVVRASLACERVYDVYGAYNCESLNMCIFCSNIENKNYYLFNKESTEERILEVKRRLLSNGWILKVGNNEYTDWQDAWDTIPKELEDYIKSLPEFDEDVWNKITKRGY